MKNALEVKAIPHVIIIDPKGFIRWEGAPCWPDTKGTIRKKLLEYFEHGTVRLFDLEADPGRQNDLSQKHPDIAKRLLNQLQQWRKTIGAEMMKPQAPTSGQP